MTMRFYLHADDGSNYLQSIYINFIHFFGAGRIGSNSQSDDKQTDK